MKNIEDQNKISYSIEYAEVSHFTGNTRKIYQMVFIQLRDYEV